MVNRGDLDLDQLDTHTYYCKARSTKRVLDRFICDYTTYDIGLGLGLGLELELELELLSLSLSLSPTTASSRFASRSCFVLRRFTPRQVILLTLMRAVAVSGCICVRVPFDLTARAPVLVSVTLLFYVR